MPRRLLVPLLATALVLLAACSDEGDASDTTEGATGGRDLRPLSTLEVTVEDEGGSPQAVLAQATAEGATWDGGIELGLEVGDLLRARAFGDATLTVSSVDDEGTAVVPYALNGLDVGLGTRGAPAGRTTPDVLTVEGDVAVATNRAGIAASSPRVGTSGAVPGAEGIAQSLDPRIVFAFLPFPDTPVGPGARWTVRGPIDLLGVTLTLDVEVELSRLRGRTFTTTAAITMSPAAGEPAPEGIQDLQLSGVATVRGHLDRLGPLLNAIAVSGTAVFPSEGSEPQPVSLDLEVEQRSADDAGGEGTS